MRFGGTLCCIIRKVLMADPMLSPVYLGKADPTYACMWLWVRLKDTLSVA